jgi:UDP-GlcNAc3NAcA epimerase
MKITTVVGARPQFIKASAVSRAIADWNGSGATTIEERIIHTGQHYDPAMSEIFFSELGLPAPAINLDVGSGSHGAQTGAMLLGLEKAFGATRPDVVLVYGDTNSTLAAAVVAAKMQIPIAHVEAGLRSGNRHMPEEINRIVTDRLSAVLFTATKAAVDHLTAEGLADRGRVVGDVMFDCVRLHSKPAKSADEVLNRFAIGNQPYVLATIHRAENTDDIDRLQNVFSGLLQVSEILPVVLPLHPRTAAAIRQGFGEVDTRKISIIAPTGFHDIMILEAHASLIITDSGGVQKEAYFHGVPCVTIRDQTEWVETVESGWNILSKARAEDIVAAVRKMLAFDRRHLRPPFYGDSHAAEKIVSCLVQEFANRPGSAA